MATRPGAFRLFQFRGIVVFLHSSWFLVALIQIRSRAADYSFIGWNVLEYLALFGIVLLHEFGHAFACRSVGGRADRIDLWPLGGIAYCEPPPRPRAVLWTVVAGPLVNVALLPVLGGLALVMAGSGASNLHELINSIAIINVGVLVFNLLPVYPMDGGQILWALLWFAIGRRRSLIAVTAIGLVGGLGLGLIAFSNSLLWLGVIALFLTVACIGSFRAAQSLKRMENSPRREEFACASCQEHPPCGRFWRCRSCGTEFDIFETGTPAATASDVTTIGLSSAPASADDETSRTLGLCPKCHDISELRCTQCGAPAAAAEWRAAADASRLESHRQRVRPPQFPSAVPIAIAACLTLIAAPVFFASVSGVGSLVVNLLADHRTEIERLWSESGVAVPGQITSPLDRFESYDVYVESATTVDVISIEVVVTEVETGEQVQATRITERPNYDDFRRGTFQLVPIASFFVAAGGTYLVRTWSQQPLPEGVRFKIGRSAEELTGSNDSFERGLAVWASTSLVFLITTVMWLFVRYQKRRNAFELEIRQFYEDHSVSSVEHVRIASSNSLVAQ